MLFQISLVKNKILAMLGKITKYRLDKGDAFFVAAHLVPIFQKMLQGLFFGIFLAEVDLGGGELVANTFDKICIGNHRLHSAFIIIPIFEVMLVASLVVEPGIRDAGGPSAGADGGAIPLIIFCAFKKLDGRKFG